MQFLMKFLMMFYSTALHYAIENCNNEIVKILISNAEFLINIKRVLN